MIITRLKLKNYRIYRDIEIDFPRGPIGIVGRNGIGKSTLLESIGWCLYGNTTARTDQKYIKTTGVDDDCSVTLELTINDMPVKIEREISKDGITNAKLFTNNSIQPIVQGSSAVGKYVENDIIKMNSKSFFNSIFAKQQELSVFSNMSLGERKKMIEKLLGIDVIEKAQTNIRKKKKNSIDKKDLISEQIKNEDSLTKQLKEKILEKKNHEQLSKTIKKNIVIASISKQKSQNIFQKLEKKYKLYNIRRMTLEKTTVLQNAENNKLKKVKQYIKSATQAKCEINELDANIKKYHIVSKKINVLTKQREKYQQMEMLVKENKQCVSEIMENDQTLKNYETKMSMIEKKTYGLKKITAKLKMLKNDETNKNNEIIDITSKFKTDKSNKIKQEQKYENMKKLGDKSNCPVCRRLLGKHYDSVLKDIQHDIDQINIKMQKKKQIKSNIEFFIKNIKKEIGDTESLLNVINTNKSKYNELEIKCKVIKNNTGKLHKKKINYDKKIKKHDGMEYSKDVHNTLKKEFKNLSRDYERVLEIKNESKKIPSLVKQQKICEKNILKFKNKIIQYQNIIKKMDYNESIHEKSKINYESSVEQYQELEKSEIDVNGKINTVDESIKFIQKDIMENKQLLQDYLDTEKKIIVLKKLENIMGEFRLYLISRIRPSLSHKTSELLKNMTRGKYSALELDEDYNIKINDVGNYYEINRFSGGEIDLVNLCFRMAISEELAERSGNSIGGFIALDEVFGSQDSERKINILQQLLGLTNRFDQILLITHIEDVREKLPYVLFIKEGSDGNVFIEKQGDSNFVMNNAR